MISHAKVSTSPPSPQGLPVVGVLPQVWRDPLAFLVRAAHDYGDVVRLDFGRQAFYLVTHPDGLKHVLQDNYGNYPKGYDKAKPLLGEGLVSSEGEFWRRQRRLMQPAFHKQRLAGFAAVMLEETEATLSFWEDAASAGRSLDVAKEMMLLTQRIIVRTMFSQDVGADSEEVARAFDVALAGLNRSLFLPGDLWERLPLPANRRFKEALATLDRAVYRIIEARRREGVREEGRAGHDLLAMLMEARDEATGEGMSDKGLRDEVMTIYLAGHETTATTLAWTFFLLSKNPAVARRLDAELREVLGGRAPGVEDLPRLRFLRAVIDEVLRLYPPAWMFARKAAAADTIGPYDIPAGAVLMLSPYVTHHRADLWENPEGFDPERFLNESDRPRYAYLPFSGGPRQCIGNNFSLMETQLIIALVRQRFSLELEPGKPVRAQPYATLRPRPGVWMRLGSQT